MTVRPPPTPSPAYPASTPPLRGPRGREAVEDEAKEPHQEEDVDAEAEEEAGDLASGTDDLLSGEELPGDIGAEGPAPQDPGSWSGQSLADLGLSLGGAHPEETEVDETEVEEVEEFAQAPAFGDAIVDFEVGEAAPEGPGGDEGDGEAIEDIQGSEEISLDAYAAEDWLRRGDALTDEGRYADALASYDRALEMEPDFAEAWDGKGDALMMTGSYDKAVRSYERALSIDPASAESWYHKGNALQMLLGFEEALGCYEEAVRIEPSFAEAWNRKGVILNRLGRYYEALESFDRALAIEPGYAAAWNSKSWAHQMLGEAQAAKEAYERARSLGYR
jgi:tetratricopeptide (TPR) repeat protein